MSEYCALISSADRSMKVCMADDENERSVIEGNDNVEGTFGIAVIIGT